MNKRPIFSRIWLTLIVIVAVTLVEALLAPATTQFKSDAALAQMANSDIGYFGAALGISIGSMVFSLPGLTGLLLIALIWLSLLFSSRK